MQPSLLMLGDRESKWMTSNPVREPFTTIDDVIKLAQELLSRLSKMSEYKHPLDIRRGVAKETGKEVERMVDTRDSREIKAGGRTYFVDVETTREGNKYLKITESRFKGKGNDRERVSIIVFPETVKEFAEAISEMAAKL